MRQEGDKGREEHKEYESFGGWLKGHDRESELESRGINGKITWEKERARMVGKRMEERMRVKERECEMESVQVR